MVSPQARRTLAPEVGDIVRRLLAAAAAAAILVAVSGALAFAAPPRAAAVQTQRPLVREIALTGTVDPLVARTLERGIRAAGDQQAAAVLVRIDTPGGLDSAMRRIVEAILGSKVPVVCWVGPQGARAASAGSIILLGCPVAAMAPGTNTGAAHPVGITGEILDDKVTNDAAAYARSLAERWGRSTTFAEQAVRTSVSVTAQQALATGVIDFVAADRAAVLRAISGRTVRTSAGPITVGDLAGARIERVRPTIVEGLLHGLIDPNLAFLFFLFGIAGVVFEVVHPGVGAPGIIGVLLLVSSLVMLGMLPVNIGGLVLLVAAVAFFVVEAHTPGIGVAMAAGLICLVVGGLFLFDASVPNARVSRAAIAGAAIGMGAFFGVVVQQAWASRRLPRPAALTVVAGAEGVVVRDCDPQGVVYAAGEEWTATATGAALAAGTRVRVAGVDGLVLRVEPLAGGAPDGTVAAAAGDTPVPTPGTPVPSAGDAPVPEPGEGSRSTEVS